MASTRPTDSPTLSAHAASTGDPSALLDIGSSTETTSTTSATISPSPELQHQATGDNDNENYATTTNTTFTASAASPATRTADYVCMSPRQRQRRAEAPRRHDPEAFPGFTPAAPGGGSWTIPGDFHDLGLSPHISYNAEITATGTDSQGEAAVIIHDRATKTDQFMPAAEAYHHMLVAMCVKHASKRRREALSAFVLNQALASGPHSIGPFNGFYNETGFGSAGWEQEPLGDMLLGMRGFLHAGREEFQASSAAVADHMSYGLRAIQIVGYRHADQSPDAPMQYLARVDDLTPGDFPRTDPHKFGISRKAFWDTEFTELSREEALLATAAFGAKAIVDAPTGHDHVWMQYAVFPLQHLNEKLHQLYRIEAFGRALPDDPIDLFRGGLMCFSRPIPEEQREAYRRNLEIVALAASHRCAGATKVLIIFDALVRTRPPRGDTAEVIAAHVERRLQWFEEGRLNHLWATVSRRKCFRHEGAAHDRGEDARREHQARRAQFMLEKRHSITKAAQCLSPQGPAQRPPDDPTELIRKLCPQPGEDFHDVQGNQAGQRAAFPVANPLQPPAEGAALRVSASELSKAACWLNTGKSTGPSGQDFFSLRLWFAEDESELVQHLKNVVDDIMAARIQPHIRNILVATREVLLPKPDGSFRPVAVGNALLRFISSAATRGVAGEIDEFFSEYQFGVRTKSGMEQLTYMARELLASRPGSVLVSTDVKNAFNSFDRSIIWPILKESFPAIYRFVALVYAAPSDQIFEAKDPESGDTTINSVPSTCGSRQGCPLGSFLYCLALQRTLVDNPHTSATPPAEGDAHRLCTCMSYCDDTVFIGTPNAVFEAFAWHAKEYTARLQGTVRPNKSSVTCLGDQASQAATREALRAKVDVAIPIHTSGTVLLGTPLGHDGFVAESARAQMDRIDEELNVVVRVPSFHTRHTLLRYSTTHKLTHLMRTVPLLHEGLNLRGRLQTLDAHMRRVVSSYASPAAPPELDALGWDIAQWPGSMGGLGVPGFERRSDATFASAYNDVSQLWRHRLADDQASRFPGYPRIARHDLDPTALDPRAQDAPWTIFRPVEAVAQAVLRLQNDLGDDFPVPEDNDWRPGLQRTLTRASSARDRRTRVIDNDDLNPYRKSVHISACGDPYTYAAAPYHYGLKIPNRAFLAVTAWRLLQPINDIAQFPRCTACKARQQRGVRPDVRNGAEYSVAHGDLCLTCTHFQRTYYYHDPFCKSLARTLRHALPAMVQVEQEHDIYPLEDAHPDFRSTRRPDVTIFGAPNLGGPVIIDVMTCTPRLASEGRAATWYTEAGRACADGEKTKRASWECVTDHQRGQQRFRDENHQFLPGCIEPGGRVGQDLRAFLEKLAHAAGGEGGDELPITRLLRDISVANARAVGNLLVSHIDTEDPGCSPRFRNQRGRPDPLPPPHADYPVPRPAPSDILNAQPHADANLPAEDDPGPVSPPGDVPGIPPPAAPDPPFYSP